MVANLLFKVGETTYASGISLFVKDGCDDDFTIEVESAFVANRFALSFIGSVPEFEFVSFKTWDDFCNFRDVLEFNHASLLYDEIEFDKLYALKFVGMSFGFTTLELV